jgi:glutathione S-transferase
MPNFRLISFPLCPYVQRAAILLAEKGVPFERVDIDLSAKPGWFLELSPLGKVPVLVVEQDGREEVLFESAVIAEYLDEILEPRLHPADPLERARHRAWIEFASATLADIYGYYTAPDAVTFAGKETEIAAKFDRLEQQLGSGPYFAGTGFSLVDSAFAPALRYFHTFERMGGARLFEGRPKLVAWREALAARPSVQGAAPADYAARLLDFIRSKGSHLAGLAADERTLAA